MSATETARRAGRPYDPASRRRAKRAGRERGCWVYIPVDELATAGFAEGEPPYYRLTGYRRSVNAGSVIVSLYREP